MLKSQRVARATRRKRFVRCVRRASRAQRVKHCVFDKLQRRRRRRTPEAPASARGTCPAAAGRSLGARNAQRMLGLVTYGFSASLHGAKLRLCASDHLKKEVSICVHNAARVWTSVHSTQAQTNKQTASSQARKGPVAILAHP